MTNGWDEQDFPERPTTPPTGPAYQSPYVLPALPSDTFGPLSHETAADDATTTTPPSHRRWWLGAVAAAAVIGVASVGGVYAYASHETKVESQAALTPSGTNSNGFANPNNLGGTNGLGNPNNGFGDDGGLGLDPNNPGLGFGNPNGNGFSLPGGGSSSVSQSSALATAAQEVGVVDVNTNLGYEGGQAAGTGMILTPSGEVLTNNHVIKGATSISVRVVSTNKTYRATVVGYSASDDVAVLQLQNASNLATVQTNTTVPTVGTTVIGVGNEGGVGGTPSAATGKVVALNQDITATDAGGGDAEHVSGLIQTDAPIAAGDSGGPLMTSDNQVVGMDTAASSNTGPTGFAIPIAHALDIAQQIESGQASATVHIGSTSFLGVSLQDNQGAQIVNVVPNTPAASIGLAAGDIVTEFNGHTISKSSDLIKAVGATKPGNSVSIHWTDTTGHTHSTTVTLMSGPSL